MPTPVFLCFFHREKKFFFTSFLEFFTVFHSFLPFATVFTVLYPFHIIFLSLLTIILKPFFSFSYRCPHFSLWFSVFHIFLFSFLFFLSAYHIFSHCLLFFTEMQYTPRISVSPLCGIFTESAHWANLV